MSQERRSFLARGARLLGGIALPFSSASAVRAAADDDEAPDYPSRPLKVIVSSPAGTAVDALARVTSVRLAAALGQPVVVENHPDAAGNIGTALAARAAPDGYTLAIVGASATINPSLYGARAVDPVRAFAPITQLTTQPIVVVAHPSLGVRSLGEAIALARAKPGRLAYSTPGVGTASGSSEATASSATGSPLPSTPIPTAGSGTTGRPTGSGSRRTSRTRTTSGRTASGSCGRTGRTAAA